MKAHDVQSLAGGVAPGDVVIVGSGVAGLSAALGLASTSRRVSILTKTELGGGSSLWAQGGVAAALGVDDEPRWHARDTLAAAAGLGDALVVEALTREGPERVRRLIELGGRFDRGPGGELALGREGAHSRRRILHADGDATGREMVRALRAAVLRHPSIEVHERAFALDLVLAGERVAGVLALHAAGGTVFHRAAAVVLATGGFGQLYRRTTNPLEATGDGLAMAARAGAVLADLEFVQFHPTALEVAEDPAPLVTEALRGEGAELVNDLGERFMTAVDPRAELAPRDVVARGILAQQRAGRRVFLDASEAVGGAFPRRFPTVWDHCRRHGIDPGCEPIPVTPAAHYAMAGVAVDPWGRASLPGLWACGEVTSTGVHGANRLASNSLLEALVFGARVADDVGGQPPARLHPRLASREVVWREVGPGRDASAGRGLSFAGSAGVPPASGGGDRRRLRRLMWENVGLRRDRGGLERALAELGGLFPTGPAYRPAVPRTAETGNLVTVGRLVAAAALAREESRGSHFRADFPREDPLLARRSFWTYEPEAGSGLPGSGLPESFPLVEAARPAAASAAREIA